MKKVCALKRKENYLLILRYMFQSGNYQAPGSFPYKLSCAGIPLKSMKCMCIMLVLGWPELWATGILNITTLSRCTTFTLLEYSSFTLATVILF